MSKVSMAALITLCFSKIDSHARLRAQVLLRIDRLLPAQKLVLKIVAVAGTNATRDLIAEVRPCSEI